MAENEPKFIGINEKLPELCLVKPRTVSTFFHRLWALNPQRSLIIGLALCSVLVHSCGGRKPSPSESRHTFCYNEPDGILSLDPAQASYRSALWTTSHLFNGLVELDSTLTIAPCIASLTHLLTHLLSPSLSHPLLVDCRNLVEAPCTT